MSPESNASASPFVIAIQNAGIEGLNHVINGAILTSAWSAGNAFLFSGSRILYGLALSGQAPRLFGRTNKRGVPFAAVIATWMPGLLAYLTLSDTAATVFDWFVNISTISGYVAWIVCLITYIRFHKAMKYQGLLDTLPYKTRFQPYAAYIVLCVLSILTLTNGFQVFFPQNWTVGGFLAAYITLPIFLALYLGHKAFKRTRFWIPVEEIDVIAGKKDMDDFCANDRDPIAKNVWRKIWFWIA